MLPKTKSLTHACLVVHLLANNHSSAPTPHCCPPRMAHFLFSFLFIIAVRPEHTHANTIRRFSQTAVAALNLTDCCTCHPSSDTHEKNKKKPLDNFSLIKQDYRKLQLTAFASTQSNDLEQINEFGSALFSQEKNQLQLVLPLNSTTFME